MVRSSLALAYRPLFIWIDLKSDKDWPEFDPGLTEDQQAQVIEGELIRAFGYSRLFTPGALRAHQLASAGRKPSVPELAGKIVAMWRLDPTPLIFQGHRELGMTDCYRDECTDTTDVGQLIDEGANVLRLDQYQADWTFEFGVPPNPIVVDFAATNEINVTDAVGDDWDCPNGDVGIGQLVHQQGTYRFPYGQVGAAVSRTQGLSRRDERDTGYGWTVVARPGRYSEALRIETPLVLTKDERFAGSVLIGL
jgi:hypothetical protein